MATEYFTDEKKGLVHSRSWATTAREILESSEYSDGPRPDTPVKMEIRYVHRNMIGFETKYRWVAHEGGNYAITIPPPLSERQKLIDSPVIQCTLLPSDNGTEDEPRKAIDITKRFLKYLGPNRDFGPSPLKVFEMFPFDDVDQFRESFHGICVTGLGKETILQVDDEIS